MLLDTYDVRPVRHERSSASTSISRDRCARASRLSVGNALELTEEDVESDDSDDLLDLRMRSGPEEDEEEEEEDEGLAAVASSDMEGAPERQQKRIEPKPTPVHMVYGARCALVLRVTSTLNLFLAMRALEPEPPDAPVLREPPLPLEVSLSK